MIAWDGITLSKVGYVPSGWMQSQEIHTHGLSRGADFWVRGLMRPLLELTHRQWLYHNATVHMKVKDGMTAAQHNAILAQMEECLLIDPMDLLMEDRELLDANFDKPTQGPTSDKLKWVTEMDTAPGAADHVAKGFRCSLRLRYCPGHLPQMRTEYEDVLIDRDGSMKWWRRRKG